MMDFLLKKEVDRKEQDERGETDLFPAIRKHRCVEELKGIVDRGCRFTGLRNKRGHSVLHVAAGVGNAEALRLFISWGVNVNALSNSKETPLHRARHADRNFEETIKILIENGANVNAKDKFGFNLVLLIVKAGRSKEDIKYVVEKFGGDWQAKTENGDTALHLAAQVGNFQAAEYLLSLGADPCIKNNADQLPIFLLRSTKKNFSKTLKLLKTPDADINQVDINGCTLLLDAILKGRSKEDVECIVKLGGNVNDRNRLDNSSALHYAADRGNLDTIEYLISNGANVNFKNHLGYTPLFATTSMRNITSLQKQLLQYGADLNATDNKGQNLLMLEVMNSKPEWELEEIMDWGINLSAVDKRGRTILHRLVNATNVAYTDLIKYSISKGANVHARDAQGRTLLHHCVWLKLKDYSGLVEHLLQYGPDINAADNFGVTLLLLSAGTGQSKQDLERIVKLGGDWKATDHDGRSILHLLASQENKKALEYFIALGADVNARNKFNETPIHNATFDTWHPFNCFNLLLKNGSDINAVDRDGNNLVHKAASRRMQIERFKELVQLVGNPTIQNNRGESVLHLLAREGNVDALKYYLTLEGVNVNVTTNEQQTPLHYITYASENFLNMLYLLLAKGANINAVTKKGNNLTFLATYHHRSTKELTEVLKQGGNWRLTTQSGYSILHAAAKVGNARALGFFISLGAYVNATTTQNETPLHRVCLAKSGFREAVTILKKKGANMGAVTKKGFTFLHLCAKAGRCKQDVKYLVEELGFDWKAKTQNGNGVLHIAAVHGNFQTVEYLLSLGADVNGRNTKENAPPLVLLAHATKGFIKTLNLLKEAGANMNAKDMYGNTLLLASALKGRSVEDVEEILKLGGDLNARTDNDRTALHLTAMGGNVQLVEHLISKGADVNLKDKFGYTPIFLSIGMEGGNIVEMIKELLKHGASLVDSNNDGENLLMLAALKVKTIVEIEEIFKLGLDWKTVDNKGQSLLHKMTTAGNVDMINFLMSKGANVNLKDSIGRTPLHLCVGSKTDDYLNLVLVLLKHGAEINEVDNLGRNVLFLAAATGKAEQDLERLVNLGADWKATDADGHSMLHVLTFQENTDGLEYFISLGADVNARNQWGMTPLHCVRFRQNPSLTVIVLVENGADIDAVDHFGRNVYEFAVGGTLTKDQLTHLLNLVKK